MISQFARSSSSSSSSISISVVGVDYRDMEEGRRVQGPMDHLCQWRCGHLNPDAKMMSMGDGVAL